VPQARVSSIMAPLQPRISALQTHLHPQQSRQLAAARPLHCAFRQERVSRASHSSLICKAAAAAAVHERVVQPVKVIEGHVKLPGSKSLSNRILLLAALAEGTTVVENILVSQPPTTQRQDEPLLSSRQLLQAAAAVETRSSTLPGQPIHAESLSPSLACAMRPPDPCSTSHPMQDSEDIRYMVSALRTLNVELDENWAESRITVKGCGGRFNSTGAELFLGNAGTAMRCVWERGSVCA
jgi:hypothetical protein